MILFCEVSIVDVHCSMETHNGLSNAITPQIWTLLVANCYCSHYSNKFSIDINTTSDYFEQLGNYLKITFFQLIISKVLLLLS